MKGCPFSNMGWESRPTFLWPRNQPEDDPETRQVSFAGATKFMMACLNHFQGIMARRLVLAILPCNPSSSMMPPSICGSIEASSGK